jgi:flagellar biogenesis protein FliO
MATFGSVILIILLIICSGWIFGHIYITNKNKPFTGYDQILVGGNAI